MRGSIGRDGEGDYMMVIVIMIHQAHHLEDEGLEDSVLLLQGYLGLGWVLGCLGFGCLVINNSAECRIARQYLAQVRATHSSSSNLLSLY